MMIANPFLVIGGVASFMIALAHFALMFKPSGYRLIGEDNLAELHEQGSTIPLGITFGTVILFFIGGIYALSGAGLLPPLPLLKSALIFGGVFYLLRSLPLPMELYKMISENYPRRLVLFSSGALILGILYLIGVFTK
jgi:hypothetical protein